MKARKQIKRSTQPSTAMMITQSINDALSSEVDNMAQKAATKVKSTVSRALTKTAKNASPQLLQKQAQQQVARARKVMNQADKRMTTYVQRNPKTAAAIAAGVGAAVGAAIAAAMRNRKR
jgi:ElaB/YqjD/DUF883 family membrane-anchored ribosome-binding protein